MTTQVDFSNGYAIVSVEGRVDTTNYLDFEKSLTEVMDAGHKKIVIDCSGMNYISSSGLRVFLITHKRMLAAGGSLTLCSLQPGIAEIFEISGLFSIFTMVPDRAALS
jgi:anti-anti-sigma factor